MARGKALDEEILTDSTYYILLALAKPNHGYGIMQDIELFSQGNVVIGPASLYTILKKLQTAELIELVADEERRKTYGLTQKGKDILRKDIQRRKLMVEYGLRVLEQLEAGGEQDGEV